MMARALRLSPGRWGLVLAVVLMGAALAVTAWSTNVGVREASRSLIRGEADLLHHDIRVRLSELDHPSEDADLAEILADHEPDGLLFLATLDAGNHIVASAGIPLGEEDSLVRKETDTPTMFGGRLCEVFRGQSRRRWGARLMTPIGRMAGILIELEPRQATELRAEASRTLEIGALAAGTLLVVAIWLGRFFLRRAEIERELERDRRLASLGQLSAVLAHEIRNPLASLKGNAQLLAAMLPDGEKARSKADRVVSEAVRLEVLTNDLLEFARTGELHRAEVDPATLLHETVASLASAGQVEIDAAGAPAGWSMDAGRMRQVLANLIDNALQAGPPVTASVSTDGEHLVYAIRDHGPGIAAEDAQRIFEPFFTKKIRGTGLGLAVVKQVIELHHGSIVVDNAPDGGAVFRLSLPKSG